MSVDLNFREDLEIDEMDLEKELAYQSILYYDYSEAFSDAKEELSKLELKLSVKKAEVGFAIRSGTYGYDGKVTEGVISELIEKDKDVIAIRKEVIQKKRETDKIASATEAVRTRRYSLQKLVDLWIYNYYNDVKGNGSQRANITRGSDNSDSQLRGLRENLRQNNEGEDE